MNSLIRWDHHVTARLQHNPQSLRGFFKLLTNVGSSKFIIPVAICIALLAWQKGEHLVSFAFLGGCALLLVPTLIKYGVRRTRPFHTHKAIYKHYKTPSFPSGHAFNSMLFYTLVASLAYVHIASPWNIPVLGTLALLVILIMYSRIYLGAHFIVDVLAGGILGFVIALLLILQIIFV